MKCNVMQHEWYLNIVFHCMCIAMRLCTRQDNLTNLEYIRTEMEILHGHSARQVRMLYLHQCHQNAYSDI